MLTGTWEVGVDGLFCRGVTTIENQITASSSWKCSKVTSIDVTGAETMNFKDVGGTLPTWELMTSLQTAATGNWRSF